jgi:hypothetical protein
MDGTMTTRAPTLVLLSLLWLIPGCSGDLGGGACTQIGCTDGLQVGLVPSEGWPAGQYVFSIETDGAMQSCSGNLPLLPCENGSSLTCQGPALASIGESGCALAPSAHGFAGISFQGMPKNVVVRIERDGAVIADRTLSPTYVTTQPNGPDCGPTCHSASAQIPVTF